MLMPRTASTCTTDSSVHSSQAAAVIMSLFKATIAFRPQSKLFISRTGGDQEETPSSWDLVVETIVCISSSVKSYRELESPLQAIIDCFLPAQKAHKASALEALTSVADKVERFISCLHNVSQNLWEPMFDIVVVKCYGQFLRTIDSADIAILIRKRRSAQRQATVATKEADTVTTPEYCLTCRKPVLWWSVNKQRTRISLAQQLDEDHDRIDGSTSLQRITLDTNENPCICSFSEQRTTLDAAKWTGLPFRVLLLRSQLVQNLLGTIKRIRTYKPVKIRTASESAPSPLVPATVLLRHLVAAVIESMGCGAFKLQLILAVGDGTKEELRSVLQELWQWFEKDSKDPARLNDASKYGSTAAIAIQVYCEIVCECRFFEDASESWQALVPIRDKLWSLAETESTNDSTTRLLLRAVSSIMCHRQLHTTTVDTQAFDGDLHTFMRDLSLHFGEARLWLDDEMKDPEVDEVMTFLRTTGILGFGETIPDKLASFVVAAVPVAAASTTSAVGNKGIRVWPCSVSVSKRQRRESLRATIGRMIPSHDASDCLSQHEALAKNRALLSKKGPNGGGRIGASILQHLNDDVLEIVFSYLGWQRLRWISGLCKTWHRIAWKDSLWKVLYTSRYELRGSPESIQDAVMANGGTWRTLFMAKRQAEHNIRLRYSGRIWKHRTCSHAGCFVVLRSPQSQQKHEAVHQRRLAAEAARRKKRLVMKEKKEAKARRTPTKTAKKRSREKDETLVVPMSLAESKGPTPLSSEPSPTTSPSPKRTKRVACTNNNDDDDNNNNTNNDATIEVISNDITSNDNNNAFVDDANDDTEEEDKSNVVLDKALEAPSIYLFE